jgi:hypothetical protein
MASPAGEHPDTRGVGHNLRRNLAPRRAMVGNRAIGNGNQYRLAGRKAGPRSGWRRLLTYSQKI